MKTFKAEPVQSKLDDPRWNRSPHKKLLIVRAENEDRAMTIADRAFDTAAMKQPGAEVLTPPWGDPDLVIWTEINDPQYPPNGEEGVIAKE